MKLPPLLTALWRWVLADSPSPRVFPGAARLALATLGTVVTFSTLSALLSPAQAETSTPPPALRIGAIATTEAGRTTIAGTSPLVDRVISEGWLQQELEKRGVRLEWVPLVGDVGSVTNEAFAAGRIDFANYGDLPSVTLNAGGVRTQVIVPSGRGADMYLLVPPGSPARSLQDLKGKRISLHRGRPWELGFIKAVESEGLHYSDFRIFNLNPQAGAAALAAGSVEAHFANGGLVLEEKGLGRVLWSTRGKPLHFKMRAELWGLAQFVGRYPELTQLVATAYVKAAYWAAQEQNREAVIQIGTRAGTPESVVRRGYDDPSLSWKDRWTPLPDEVVETHYRDVVAFARTQKLIRRDLDPRELVNPRFVRQALRDLQLEAYWTPWQGGNPPRPGSSPKAPLPKPAKAPGGQPVAVNTPPEHPL